MCASHYSGVCPSQEEQGAGPNQAARQVRSAGSRKRPAWYKPRSVPQKVRARKVLVEFVGSGRPERWSMAPVRVSVL